MQLPGPLRALVGLIAVTAEEAKHLPDRAVELPMLAVSSALQASLRAQQRYARLAARGDDVLHRRPSSDEPPGWATFDAPLSAAELRGSGLADPDPALRARAASQLLDELLGVTDDTPAGDHPGPSDADTGAGRAPARKAPARRATGGGTAKAAPAAAGGDDTEAAATPDGTPATAPAKKAAAPSAGTRRQPAKSAGQTANAARTRSTGKAISKPRHTPPSRFDTVQDD